MHVKFLARGSGSAGAAGEYLLEEENAAGEEREEVEVLRGIRGRWRRWPTAWSSSTATPRG